MQSKKQKVAVAVALMLLAFLGVVVAVALSGAPMVDLAILSIAVVTLMIGAAPSLLNALRPPQSRHSIFAFLSALYAVYFTISIFFQYFLGDGQPTSSFDTRHLAPTNILNAQIVALSGLIAIAAGYALPIAPALVRGRAVRADWAPPTAMIIAVIMIVAGWFIFVLGQLRLIPENVGNGLLGNLTRFTHYGVALLWILRLRYNLTSATWLLVLFVPPTMVLSFFTGSKELVLAPLISIAFAHILVKREIKARWVVAGLTGIVVLYPIAAFYREYVLVENQLGAMDALRYPGRTLSFLFAFLGGSNPIEYLQAGLDATATRLNLLGVLGTIVRDTPGVVPYQGGWTLSFLFISFIPRILWPGKPQTTVGQWVTDNYGAGPGVISSTGISWPGELYMNFGIVGVLIGMVLLGIWIRGAHQFTLGRDLSNLRLLAAVIVMWQVGTTIERQIIAPVTGLVVSFIILGGYHALASTLSPTRTPSPSQAEPAVAR